MDALSKGVSGQLRRLGRHGICVISVEPLLQSAANASSVEVLHYLVQDLGADVDGARPDGGTPLYVAAQKVTWR
jgi:hypothetical protein